MLIMSINGSKNYEITQDSDFSAIQRINRELNNTPVLSTYLPLHVDPTRAIGQPAEWASRGRQFSTNPTDNSNDELQQQLLVQGVNAIAQLIRKSNIDAPVQMDAVEVVMAKEVFPQRESFKVLRNPTATKLREVQEEQIAEPTVRVTRASAKRARKALEQDPRFSPRRDSSDLPPVPDATISFIRSLQEE